MLSLKQKLVKAYFVWIGNYVVSLFQRSDKKMRKNSGDSFQNSYSTKCWIQMFSNQTFLQPKANEPATTEAIIVAYYSLTITIGGTILNLLTFVVFCRSTFRDTNARPTLHYMRAMAIFDILMLYGWNIDHYFFPVHNFLLQTVNIFACRLLSFLNYFAAQSSAWLRVFVCIDRYFSLSRLHRTWLNRSKNVLIIIASIMVVLSLLNAHFFIFTCYYETDGKMTTESWLYKVYPLWDNINLGVYNCAPFVLMTFFNSGVIYHLVKIRQTTTVQNSRIDHRAISITLVITTFLFLLMTVPATVAFGFFPATNRTILRFLDGFLYGYHAWSFFIYFLTFQEFRKECIAFILCKPSGQQVATNQVNTAPTKKTATTQSWIYLFSWN